MSKTRFIISSIIVLFFLTIVSIVLISYKYSKIPFINTTGFYFDGIDADDTELIEAFGTYNNEDVKTKLHCFQQYRTTDEYIYLVWRKDLQFNLKADKITLQMPDSIWFKINNIWFKNGESVIKYSASQIEKDWDYMSSNGKTTLISTDKQITKNNFKDGFILFLNSSYIKGIYNKYVLLGLSFIFLLSIYFTLHKHILRVFIKLFDFIKSGIQKHKAFWSRTFSIFAGLFTILLLLEIVLRIIGYIHENKNIDKNYKLAENADKVIICLGDSFTEGFGASEGNDYPAVLNKLVKSEFGEEYQTLNFGQSGKNTTQIKEEFLVYLENNTPELVIIMAGSANYWNYYGFEDRGKLLYNIRVFKLFKLLYKNLTQKQNKDIAANKHVFYNLTYYNNRRSEFYLNIKSDSISGRISPIIKDLNCDISLQSIFDSVSSKDTIDETIIRDIIYYSIITNNELNIPSSDKNKFNHELEQLLFIYNVYFDNNPKEIQFADNYYSALYNYILFAKKQDIRYLYYSLVEDPYFEDSYKALESKIPINPLLPQDFENKACCSADTIIYYKQRFGLINENTYTQQVHIIEDNSREIKTKKINQWVENDLEEIIYECRNKGVKILIMT